MPRPDPKFTPGPWGIPEISRRPILVSAGVPVTWDGMIASVDAGDYARSVEEGKANARLIAAAPDLYAHLARALSIMDNIAPADFPLWKQEARAALARADGAGQ